MNYIIHLNAFHQKALASSWMNPRHIALYMALFHEWNRNRFATTFRIVRDDIMKAAKITSHHTYYRCMKELQEGHLLQFNKASSSYSQATVEMMPLGSTCDVTEHPIIKTIIKNNKNSVVNSTPTLQDISDFFDANNYDNKEALKFFYHNEATGWSIGTNKITNWQAMAHKWMLLQTSPKTKHVEKIPDYDEPF